MSRRAPRIPIRPHSYTPDPNDPGDWEGKKRCLGCSMPWKSRVHKFTPLVDESARIIGEEEV